jgi:hypothetical protein
MRESVNVYTIGAVAGFVKRSLRAQDTTRKKRDCPPRHIYGEGDSPSEPRVPEAPPAASFPSGIYPRRQNGYNKGSPSAEVAELADA